MIAPLPSPNHREPLYVGIDISKSAHMVALISSQLLRQHGAYNACPILNVENSRPGFEHLARELCRYASISDCHIVMEQTGHYHRPLLQFLTERGATVYQVHVQKRLSRNKSDKKDALNLANMLYNQIELKAMPTDTQLVAHRVTVISETALRLRGMMHHRYELSQESTRRKNKLISIADQLFPELTQVIKDVNGASALRLRETYATPAEFAAAPIAEIKALCPGQRPGKAALAHLQELARCTIGMKNPVIVDSLVFEKRQLITELRMLQEHTEAIDQRIASAIEESREGRILISIPGLSPLRAAFLIASIGDIKNFANKAKLKAYLGWAPQHNQTGTSVDTMRLSRSGNKLLKQTMYLAGLSAIRGDTEWQTLYKRLLPIKCQYDARTGQYKGRKKVLGRVIGQIIDVIYTLLRRDHDLLTRLEPGETPPPPMCYDREVHRAHRNRY